MKLNMIRKGIKDVWWRPYMVSGAKFSENDIPFCPTTATEMPALILTYKEAKEMYRKEIRRHNKDFMSLAYVCFYADDGDFDSFKGIWFRSSHAYKVLSHFAGIITPDFSLYQDFPLPLKLWNVYRMRAFGYWFGTLDDRERFEEGLKELVRRLHPHTIIVYGSANYKCFKELEEQGITILAYPSKTNKAFAGRVKK